MDGAYIALKGYKFQFDRSIIEIFKNPTKKVEIEQLQDYGMDDYYVQVKHHDTSYTPSQQKQKIKAPLLQLMAQHKQASSSNFILYIYLKGVPSSEKKLNLLELESYLGNKSTNFTKPEKLAFAKHFTLIHASNFNQQHKSVISEIRKAYSISAAQAELFYSLISSHLLEVVTKHPSEKRSLRVSSKKVIDKLISDGKRLVFKSVFIDELSKQQQFNLLNKQFFKGPLNKEPHERIFVIDTDSSNSLTALKEIVLVLKSKWSKNRTKTIPASDRFAPYVFFRGATNSQLKDLKVSFQKDGFEICDGHEFKNAPFNLQAVKRRPTFENRIFFKFINSAADLKILSKNLDRTGEVYQFFKESALPFKFAEKHIKIQIGDIEDIKNII